MENELIWGVPEGSKPVNSTCNISGGRRGSQTKSEVEDEG